MVKVDNEKNTAFIIICKIDQIFVKEILFFFANGGVSCRSTCLVNEHHRKF